MERKMRPALYVTGLLCLFALPACEQEPAGTTSRTVEAFHKLLDEHWAAAVSEKIYFRSDGDAWRMDGKLSEHTAEARARRQAFNNSMLERLQAIDPQSLNGRDRISLQVFRYERETERDSYQQYDYLFPFMSMVGYHTYFAEAPSSMSFLGADDYDNYLVSLDDFPRYNDEHIALLREAIEIAYTHYCGSIKDYARTMRVHIVDDPQKSALFVPFGSFPETFTQGQKAAYTRKGLALIEDEIVPAYEKLLQMFESEYLPACRKSPGISSLPGGDEYYRYLIRFFTTTEMSPQEIHELGLSEVDRIQGEMREIIESVGFSGDFNAFLEQLRSEPQFYAKSVAELLGRAALISKTAEGAAPRFFSLLPRGTYSIKANPNRGTYYMPSSGDGTTAGIYFVSTKDLASQPLYALEALSLHEGVPGHHLQSALAMELGLPAFQRTLYHAAYSEGWGLYSERLGKEMGFYTDPYSDFGRLTAEAWRACRLVVDTGIHAFGWSRQQAVDYMLANTAVSVLEANDEIDRYITWPGQALAYKIGELKIRELRAYAESELGAAFDIRGFHDTVVGNGSVPIAILEEIVNDWIAQEKRGL
jgi:uncharacterized protein (DUF885 family)